jgi:ferric-dicitrate binding protein FerR (iron transport regulator)
MKEEKKEDLIYKYLEGKLDREKLNQLKENLIYDEKGYRELLGKLWQHDLYPEHEGELPDKKRIINEIHHRININKDQKLQKNSWRKVQRTLTLVAASLFIPLALWVGYNQYKTNNIESTVNEQYVEVYSQRGVRSKINLPDGSEVWLNNASKLRYPVVFKKKRIVELEGEGYFEIEKNAESPFVVNTKHIDVKVLGTKFNVMSYDDDNRIEVALLEGKVALYRDVLDENKALSELKPGELASFMKADKQLHIRETDVKRHIAWKDGKLVFYEVPLAEVAHKMERWYNCEIVITDKELAAMHLTATFEGENLEQALKLMCMAAPTSYQLTPAQKHDDGTFTKQKVTINKKCKMK